MIDALGAGDAWGSLETRDLDTICRTVFYCTTIHRIGEEDKRLSNIDICRNKLFLVGADLNASRGNVPNR